MTFSVSQSKVKTWRACKRKYFYKYIRNLMRKRKAKPLLRGTVVHLMIEAKIEGRDPWEVYHEQMKVYGKLFVEEIEEYGDLPEELRLMMEGYFAYYKKDPLRYIKHDGRKTEWPFEVDLCKGIVFKGRVDTAARTRDKRVWLVEHKSHKQIPVSEFKFTDIQSVSYSWVLPQIGLPEVDGVCWDYIRAKPPAVPDQLKDGSITRKKSIDTTWAVYAATLKAHGKKLSDYKDMKELLEGKEQDFYRRVFLPLSDTVKATMVDELQVTAKEMRRRGGKYTTRTIDKHCDWCEYSDICRAELVGLDADFIEKTNYKQRED